MDQIRSNKVVKSWIKFYLFQAVLDFLKSCFELVNLQGISRFGKMLPSFDKGTLLTVCLVSLQNDIDKQSLEASSVEY